VKITNIEEQENIPSANVCQLINNSEIFYYEIKEDP
jgi:hypothetical protein